MEERQIRRPQSALYGCFLLCALFLLFGVPLASVLAVIYGVLSWRNDRMIYDEAGITMYSIWGKPFRTSWDGILGVEVAQEPLISRQLYVSLVLRIRCRERTYRYPYREYVGINEFLEYLDQR